MLSNYLRIVFRDLRRNPGFYFINISGLAIGLAACLMISSYVRFHRSFDKQPEAYADTYRVQYSRWSENEDRVEFASASPTIGPAIKTNFPEVQAFARAYKTEGIFFKDEHYFEEQKVFRAESGIFNLLGIKVIRGQAAHCLDEPTSVAISESTAKKYFGTNDPLGKTLSYNKQQNLKVTAVFKDLPPNMHMKADIFVALAAWMQRDPELFSNGWFNSGFYTYVKLAPGTDPEKINRGIEAFIERELGSDLAKYKMGMSFRLQPLRDIHLTSHYMHELEANGDKSAVNLLGIVGWFILVIAWVNFFNLSTIASLRKQREMAIRKVNGASRFQLLFQLLIWSAFINLAAVIIAVGIFELIYPFFSQLTGLPPSSQELHSTWFYITITLAFLAGTFSAGIYSVTGIYSAKVIQLLKAGQTRQKNGRLMKKGLLTLQFAIGIAIIAATMGVYLQFRYITKQDTGFCLDNILVVKAPVVGDSTLLNRFKSFTDEINAISGVQGCAFSSVVPGQANMFNRGGIYRVGQSENDAKNYRITETGQAFFDTYKIRFIAGEGFTGNAAIDRQRVVINANAAANLGYAKPQDAVGKKIMMEQKPWMISGVVIDFLQRSPKESIEPQIFRYPQRFQGKFSINTGKSDAEQMIKVIESIYSKIFPNNPFNASFLKNYYYLQFEQEKRYTLVFTVFSTLVVFITILGLIGLSAYTAEQRKKEIGIRKALGASDSWLFWLLFKDYILLWVLASAIALPVFYIKFDEWLAGFATQLPIPWWIYFTSAIMVLIISFITVWIQSRRIIALNPVENLKYE